ncbi:MAG: hypothetical protein KAH33_07380, partial [Candidatus Delongbacteria bacterium]|nr:hypothetical protein [Candidatus Delongbacteria bacterium]
MLKKKENNRAGLIVLIDPDKIKLDEVRSKIKIYEEQGTDTFFFGSSQPVKNDIHTIAQEIRDSTSLPLILFP